MGWAVQGDEFYVHVQYGALIKAASQPGAATADSLTSTPACLCLEDGGHFILTKTEAWGSRQGYLKSSLTTEASQKVFGRWRCGACDKLSVLWSAHDPHSPDYTVQLHLNLKVWVWYHPFSEIFHSVWGENKTFFLFWKPLFSSPFQS